MKKNLLLSSIIGIVLSIDYVDALEPTKLELESQLESRPDDTVDLYSTIENNEATSTTDTIKKEKDLDLFANVDIYFSYENYTPADRNEYTYQGVNIELQKNYTYKDSQVAMSTGPNVSFLADKYKGNEEKVVFLKWDQGLSYSFDLGQNFLLQPLAQIGLGYGWVDSQKDQQSPIFELLAGINFKPSNEYNIYAKSGYRYFELNNEGQKSLGDLKGGFAMIGFGMSI